MNANTKKINGVTVRNFSGFYNSIWFSPDTCYYANDYFDTSGIEWDIDYNKYTADVAAAFFNYYEDCIYELFPDDVIKLDFAGLWSPHFYNYETDEILYNLEIKDLQQFNARLLSLIMDNYEDLKKQISERFTSCSGFISFYSNNLDSWINDVKTGEADAVQIAVLIDFFVLLEEPDAEIIIYEDLNGNGYAPECYMYPEPESLENKLNEFKAAIEAENISFAEIAELQNLAAWIPEHETTLREWAGIPENPEDYNKNLVC